MDTNMASSSITDHGGLWRRLIPEKEPFFILGILLVLRVRVIPWLGGVSEGRICASSRLLDTTLPLVLASLLEPWGSAAVFLPHQEWQQQQRLHTLNRACGWSDYTVLALAGGNRERQGQWWPSLSLPVP